MGMSSPPTCCTILIPVVKLATKHMDGACVRQCHTGDVDTIAPVGAVLTGSGGIARETYQAIFIN
jgi:hypothetical protein